MLFVKVLLSQHQPCSGHSCLLSSRTIHGLVAYHLSQYFDGGDTGDDDPSPSKVLLSFLYRYGATLSTFRGDILVDESARTELSHTTTLFLPNGALAVDMSSQAMASSVELCTNVFHSGWETLVSRLRSATTDTSTVNKADSLTPVGVLFGGCSEANGNNRNIDWILSPLIDVPRLHRVRYDGHEHAQNQL